MQQSSDDYYGRNDPVKDNNHLKTKTQIARPRYHFSTNDTNPAPEGQIIGSYLGRPQPIGQKWGTEGRQSQTSKTTYNGPINVSSDDNRKQESSRQMGPLASAFPEKKNTLSTNNVWDAQEGTTQQSSTNRLRSYYDDDPVIKFVRVDPDDSDVDDVNQDSPPKNQIRSNEFGEFYTRRAVPTSMHMPSNNYNGPTYIMFSDDGTQEHDESRRIDRQQRAYPMKKNTLTTNGVWDDQIQGESTENQPEEPVSGGKVEMDPLEAELSMTNQKTMQELTAQTKRLQLKEPVITKQALIEKEQSDDDGNEGCSFTVYRTCNIQ